MIGQQIEKRAIHATGDWKPVPLTRRVANVVVPLLALMFGAVTGWVGEASACSYHQPSHVDIDTAAEYPAPTVITPKLEKVTRGVAPTDLGCSGGQTATSCDDLGVVEIGIDGDTSGQAFIIETRGNAPKGMSYSSGVSNPLTLASETPLILSWIDGAEEEQEAFSFDLRVTSMSLSGEMGPTSEWITIAHGGREEALCSNLGQKISSLSPFAFLMLGIIVLSPVVRRRRELG